MKNFCRALAVIELVFGAIISFIFAIAGGRTIRMTKYGPQTGWNIGLTAAVFLVCMASFLISFAVLYALGEVLENQEKLMELLSLLKHKASGSQSHPLPSAPKNQETGTKEAGKALAGTGEAKPEACPKQDYPEPAPLPESFPDGTWKCSECRRINDRDREICVCGSHRPGA